MAEKNKNGTGAQDATGDHRNPRTKRFGGHPQTTLLAERKSAEIAR